MEKKVETLLRENEKLKNDLRANRKNMFSAGSGAPGSGAPVNNFHAAMVGKAAFDKYSGGVNKSTVLGPGGFSGVGGHLGVGGLLCNTLRWDAQWGVLISLVISRTVSTATVWFP